MKKLLLLPFALLIMGILFFGCEKDPVQEEFSIKQQSTERSGHLIYDGFECVDSLGGCHCRLINYAPMFDTISITLCPVGVINPLSDTGAYSGLTWGDRIGFCEIPPNSCYPDTISGLFEYFYTYYNENEACDSCPHPTHDDPHSFCSPQNNLFKLCNHHGVAVEFALVCEPDIHPSQYTFFTIPPGECKIIRIQNCSVSLCD